MAEVRAVPTAKQKLDEGVIEMLERTIAEARDGKFESIMMVLMRADGASCTRFTGGVEPLRRVGALECLKWDALEVWQRNR
jgi:hypothetical protein